MCSEKTASQVSRQISDSVGEAYTNSRESEASRASVGDAGRKQKPSTNVDDNDSAFEMD